MEKRVEWRCRGARPSPLCLYVLSLPGEDSSFYLFHHLSWPFYWMASLSIWLYSPRPLPTVQKLPPPYSIPQTLPLHPPQVSDVVTFRPRQLSQGHPLNILNDSCWHEILSLILSTWHLHHTYYDSHLTCCSIWPLVQVKWKWSEENNSAVKNFCICKVALDYHSAHVIHSLM